MDIDSFPCHPATQNQRIYKNISTALASMELALSNTRLGNTSVKVPIYEGYGSSSS